MWTTAPLRLATCSACDGCWGGCFTLLGLEGGGCVWCGCVMSAMMSTYNVGLRSWMSARVTKALASQISYWGQRLKGHGSKLSNHFSTFQHTNISLCSAGTAARTPSGLRTFAMWHSRRTTFPRICSRCTILICCAPATAPSTRITSVPFAAKLWRRVSRTSTLYIRITLQPQSISLSLVRQRQNHHQTFLLLHQQIGSRRAVQCDQPREECAANILRGLSHRSLQRCRLPDHPIGRHFVALSGHCPTVSQLSLFSSQSNTTIVTLYFSWNVIFSAD